MEYNSKEIFGWDGMGWDGMGWDGMGWDGMGKHLKDKRSLLEYLSRKLNFLRMPNQYPPCN